MARKIENQEGAAFATRVPDNRRYIFFTDPPEVWIGDVRTENHEALLSASGRERSSIAAIGFTDQLEPDTVLFDQQGSSTLHIRSGDPQQCVDFIKSLPAGKRHLTFAVSKPR